MVIRILMNDALRKVDGHVGLRDAFWRSNAPAKMEAKFSKRMTAPRQSRSSLAPMRHALFRAVWISSLASNFGGLIQSVGAAWLMASIAPSAEMVALVQTSTTLPIMFFSLAAGA